MILDIFLMWLVLYYTIRLVRNNSRTIQIFKGVLLIIFVDGIAKLLGLRTVAFITDIFINWGFLAIIIIFQPEIRSILERLGKSNVFSRITTLTGNEKEHLVDQIVTATMLLSQNQTGALISIEQSHSLEDFISTGTRLNSDVTAELLTSIFVTSTPLHDGAVIIQGDKIACASAYFPPTNLELPSKYGARHRAAIGISEISDAVTIVVSEETGSISVAEAGKITPVNRKELRDYLLRVILGEETEVKGTKTPVDPARAVVIDDRRALEDTTTIREKLTIKKQDTGKIEVEEVVASEPEEVPETIIEDKPKKKKKRFGLFGREKTPETKPASEESDASIEQLEKEAKDIKMPKKKKKKAKEDVKVETAAQVEEKPQETVVEDPSQHRMTSEDIERMRNQFIQQFSTKDEKVVEPAPVEQPAPKQPEPLNFEDNTRRFDTSKLDISKIMGMNNDLEDTLKMVDSIPKDDSSKGGDR